MFEGFRREFIQANGVEIHAVVGGDGPPLLLLHGYPQTHVIWHKIAPALAERFTVVAADLRGYGDSAKPAGGPGHAAYSKREMAADQVAVMAALGFDRFALVGHDRGGRVAHRLALERSLDKLSSGLRITRAGDDAAGLAISEQLRAQIRGLRQAERNANDGISVIQTAEGALNEISNILIRMRELAMQAASQGSIGQSERSFIQNEFSSLQGEITRIASGTRFNNRTLLDGSLSGAGNALTFQVGIFNDPTIDRISLEIGDATASGLAIQNSDAAVSTAAAAQASLTTIDSAISSLSTVRGNLGAAQNRLTSTIANLATSVENLSAANSRIRDVDVAAETANLTRNQVLQQAGIAVLAQANVSAQVALVLLQ